MFAQAQAADGLASFVRFGCVVDCSYARSEYYSRSFIRTSSESLLSVRRMLCQRLFSASYQAAVVAEPNAPDTSCYVFGESASLSSLGVTHVE